MKNTVSIIEGFNLTGKSTFIKDVLNVEPYHFDYKSLDSQPDTAHYPAYDRSIISSYVYSRLYDDFEVVGKIPVFDFFKKFEDCDSVDIYYVHHSLEETAKKIYDHTLANWNDSHDKPYEKFFNFDDYWTIYRGSEDWFLYILKLIDEKFDNVNIYDVATVPTDDGLTFNIEEERF